MLPNGFCPDCIKNQPKFKALRTVCWCCWTCARCQKKWFNEWNKEADTYHNLRFKHKKPLDQLNIPEQNERWDWEEKKRREGLKVYGMFDDNPPQWFYNSIKTDS